MDCEWLEYSDWSVTYLFRLNFSIIMLEAVSRGALLKRCPEKIRKIHRETNAMDSFFSNVAGQAYHFIKNEHHCSCFPVNLKIFLQ